MRYADGLLELSNKGLYDFRENLYEEMNEIRQECLALMKDSDKFLSELVMRGLRRIDEYYERLYRIVNFELSYKEDEQGLFHEGAKEDLEKESESLGNGLNDTVKSLKKYRSSLGLEGDPLEELFVRYVFKAEMAGVSNMIYEARLYAHTGYKGIKK